jgi:hypothetical protein
MQTFLQWLSQLNLLRETYYTFDPKQYDAIFDTKLEKVIARTSDPAHRQILERMRGFSWLSYIAGSVRHAGYRDQREVQERTHDVATKLLIGTLFRGFDERTSGPMDLRFKRSVANAIRNMAELERNRRHYLPTVSIGGQFEPGGVTDLSARSLPNNDEKIINDFRRLVRKRLGDIGIAVLDVRLEGGETKSLVGLASLGSPGKWIVKRTVQQVKELAREFFQGDPELLRKVEKAMASEEETMAKRRTAMAARQVVGV